MPTVLFATEPFAALALHVASARGLPAPRMVSVEHPIGGIDEQGVLGRAEAVVEDLIGLLTARPA